MGALLTNSAPYSSVRHRCSGRCPSSGGGAHTTAKLRGVRVGARAASRHCIVVISKAIPVLTFLNLLPPSNGAAYTIPFYINCANQVAIRNFSSIPSTSDASPHKPTASPLRSINLAIPRSRWFHMGDLALPSCSGSPSLNYTLSTFKYSQSSNWLKRLGCSCSQDGDLHS